MIDINRDTEDGEVSPFQEEIILGNYFPCAVGRKYYLECSRRFKTGRSLIALIGEEGSGKTMLCHMLAHEALGLTVFFPHAVDSFDEVVREIAVNLGLAKEMDSQFGGLDQRCSTSPIICSIKGRSYW